MDFKHKLLECQTLTGTWVTLASPLVAEALGYLGYLGFDFLVIDTEHAPATRWM
jgi:2-keto-3-deoxy-L-rhamnonate aldolase RhmA